MDHPVTRRFWCRWSGREVEVQFLAGGLFGLGSPVAVRRCSVFEPASAIECQRRCLDATYRRSWEPALPLRGARE